jgi:hypothetical protein
MLIGIMITSPLQNSRGLSIIQLQSRAGRRVARHPDDVAFDRKIGSICRGC